MVSFEEMIRTLGILRFELGRFGMKGLIIINSMNKKRQFDLEFKIPNLPVKVKQEPSRQTSLTA